MQGHALLGDEGSAVVFLDRELASQPASQRQDLGGLSEVPSRGLRLEMRQPMGLRLRRASLESFVSQSHTRNVLTRRDKSGIDQPFVRQQ